MHIAYIVSQYPARSETFVAREMNQLARQGRRITLARLRWSDTQDGLRVPEADVLPLQWSPIRWCKGLGWALVNRPRALVQMARDIGTAPVLSSLWQRLLILALVSLALARTLEGRSVDHLRAHLLDSEAIAAYWIGSLLDRPFSVTLHTRKTRFPSPLLRRVARSTAFIAAISHETRRLAATMSGREARICTIRNGVSVSPTLPRSLPRTPPTWRLLAVGRLVEKKGFDVLVRACRLLRAWGRPVQCTLIGAGPQREALARQIRRNALQDRMTLRGAQPNAEVYRALRRHDLLVAPSRPASDGDRDGIPTVLIEALSQGVPVVASAFAAIPELVQDGETGRLVTPGAPVTLARTLHRLFDAPQHAARMGRNGREQIRRCFSVEREGRRLDTWIQHTSARSTPSD